MEIKLNITRDRKACLPELILTREEAHHFERYDIPKYIQNKYLWKFLQHKGKLPQDFDLQSYHGSDTLNHYDTNSNEMLWLSEDDFVCTGLIEFKRDFGYNPVIEILEDPNGFIDVVAKEITKEYEKKISRIKDVKQYKISVNYISTTENGCIKRLEDIVGHEEIRSPQLVLNGKVYSLTLTELEEDQNVINDSIITSIKNMLESDIRAKDIAHEEEVEKLRDEINKANNDGFTAGISLANKLGSDWQIIKDDNNNLFLEYQKDIICTGILTGTSIYKLKPEYVGLFYIKGLRIPAKSTTTKAYCKDAKHFNVSGKGGTVCIGDLAGKPIDYIVEHIVDELKIMGANSRYPSNAANGIFLSGMVEDAPINDYWGSDDGWQH
jgi:hypothetical protein